MTANRRRIVLNIVATYGRSLYALAIGLVTAQWALLAIAPLLRPEQTGCHALMAEWRGEMI